MRLRRHFLSLLLPAVLAGCGGFSMPNLWPFGEHEVRENSRKPANATEYRCADGKAFFVRTLEGGAVWLIAPDRDIRLEKQPNGGFGVGRVSLELRGDVADLNDPPATYSNCKRAG